ncbi:MAG TPA: ABC transporter ATP-binding protein [Beijerinckiaceae bacterium]|jgi:branched-chain amino acid transport system ATP-binding protein|nr:ABC transporter ATP-binding protein [Beijerinckiaceae bacterium]
MNVPALALYDLAIRFGGIAAVDHVSFSISEGDFVGLIGPNGAGKTTLIRLISGILAPHSGRVDLLGADVTRRSTATRVRRGLALTHQVVRPFRTMSVLDNIVLAAGHRRTVDPLRALLQTDRQPERERAESILRQVGLAGVESKLAGSLPLGQLKRLEIARALALDPTIVLLDEPLAGLNNAEAAEQIDMIGAVNASGVTILLVEHNLEEVIRACRRLIVLANGRVIGDGLPRDVMRQDDVRAAYLGQSVDVHA